MTSIKILQSAENLPLTADIVVVGTGAGSAAAAGELRRRGASVLMIEAGSALTEKAGQHLRNVMDDESFNNEAVRLLVPHAGSGQALPGLPGARGMHSIGGMMTAWSHAVPRPNLEEEWDGTVAPEDLSRHLKDAETRLWANDSLYGNGSKRQQWAHSKLTAGLGITPRRVPLAARRTQAGLEYAGADALLEAADDAAVLTILTGHVVTKIVHRQGKGVSVVAVNSAGKPVTFNAGAIIVGAGAIGTPQLLHASGLHHPALGRYLTDHLNLVTRIYLDDEAPVDDLGQEWPINIYLPVSSGRPFHTAVLDIPSVAHAGVLANSAPGRTTDIGTFIGTEPREENRLVFDNTAKDGFGLPAVRADVRLTELDHKNSEQAFTDQYTIARTLGQPWHGMSPQLRPFGSSLHLMGTHRIGTDEQSSVADQYGLLRGSENIYVVGNGVLGSRNSCNPTLTTVALALRTAEHLQQ